MKKYLFCLLALGLLVGCSVEKDDSEIVSPPAEQIPEDNKQDNDEQTSTENDDAQDAIEYVEKLDDTEDWVYYIDTSNEKYYDYSEKSLDEWLNVFVDPEKKGYPIFVNIKSEDAYEYNYPSPTLDQNGNPITNSGLYNSHVHSSAYTWEISKNFVSILTKGVSSGSYTFHSTNFSLIDGKKLSNDDLLNFFDLTEERVSEIALKFLKEQGCISVLERKDQNFQCLYFEEGTDRYNFSVKIDDESILYVDENNQLNAILEIITHEYPNFKIIVNLMEK